MSQFLYHNTFSYICCFHPWFPSWLFYQIFVWWWNWNHLCWNDFMQCILSPNIFAANLTNKPLSWMSCGVYGLNYHPMAEKLPNLWIYWDSFRLKRYKTKRKYVNLCKRLFRSSNPKIPLWQHTPIQISMAVYPNLSNSMDIIWKVIHVWSATIQR